MTFAWYDRATDLAAFLHSLAESLDAEPMNDNRIVLVIPEHLRELLQWNSSRAPRAEVYGLDYRDPAMRTLRFVLPAS